MSVGARLDLSPEPVARVGGPVRVLVVDDSATVRAIFARIVSSQPELELAAVASTAEEALDLLTTLHVNVILLDLEMPGMGGMAALPKIIAKAPRAKVLVVSSLTSDGAEHSVKAMGLGAADTLLKPVAGGFDEAYRTEIVGRIRALGRRPLRREMPVSTERPAAPPISLRPGSREQARILAIGASTGGIHAMSQLFGALPPRIGVPILITQHLPASFMPAFARQLEAMAKRPAHLATVGARLLVDNIYVAPGDAHMVIVDNGGQPSIKFDRAPTVSGCMPSVDPMFSSIALAFGAHALAVVLTGMGRDGTEGARDVAAAGGTVLVQNEQSAAVWGMPGSVAKAGLATAVLHPADLAARVVGNIRRL